MTNTEFAAARRTLGYTQQELGDKLDMTRRHIGALERGQATIHRTTALAMRYLLAIHHAGAAGVRDSGT